jgi:alkylhydroperoxidase family enzyme
MPDRRSPGWLRIAWRLRDKAQMPAPYRVAARHPLTFVTRQLMEVGIVASRSVDKRVKELAGLRAASMIGCVW